MAVKIIRDKPCIVCTLQIPTELSPELTRLCLAMEQDDDRKGRRGTFTRWVIDVLVQHVEQRPVSHVPVSSSRHDQQDAELLINL